MIRHVAFLRAINVGGRRVTNADLERIATHAGFGGVQAYQASGNLLFDPADRDPATSAAELEEVLAEGLGFHSQVYIRTPEDLAAILAADPFEAAALEASTGAPQVMFLAAATGAATAERIDALSTAIDRLVVVGSEVHWLPSAGVGRSVLDGAAIAALVGPVTVRTRGTVARLLAKMT